VRMASYLQVVVWPMANSLARLMIHSDTAPASNRVHHGSDELHRAHDTQIRGAFVI